MSSKAGAEPGESEREWPSYPGRGFHDDWEGSSTLQLRRQILGGAQNNRVIGGTGWGGKRGKELLGKLTTSLEVKTQA